MKNKKAIIISCVVILVLLVGICIALLFNNKNQGSTMSIEFYDNSSMGNSWKYYIDNIDIISINSKTDYSECGDQDGCGGKIIYTIKPLKPGKVKIDFKWMSIDDKSQEDAVYELTIDNNLSISEKHSGTYFESDYYQE